MKNDGKLVLAIPKKIWFAKPKFIKYENQILIWKVIWLSCTLSQFHFLCQDCPSGFYYR